MNEGDNRLMLDLDNSAHRYEIYNAIKKDGRVPVTLTELGCDFDEYTSIDVVGNSYVTEIVVPFTLDTSSIKNNKIVETTDIGVFKTLSDVSVNRMKLDRSKFMLLPGNDNWFYYKLYGCSKRQNELIVVAYDMLEKIVAEGIAQKYFFIRYFDPEPHLRIRIHPTEERTPELFVRVSRWLDVLYNNGLISRAVSDSYIREVERYGGPLLIEHAENYFYSDSKLVMELLSMHRFGDSRLNLDLVGVSFITSTLESFGLSLEEQGIILDFQSEGKQPYRKEFQNNRKMFMRAVDSSDDWFEIRAFTQSPDAYNLINNNSQELKKLARTIYDFDQRGELTNSIRGIVLSVIHMFCNRLMGSNAWERKMYALAKYGVHDLRGFLNHQQKISLDLVLPNGIM